MSCGISFDTTIECRKDRSIPSPVCYLNMKKINTYLQI